MNNIKQIRQERKKQTAEDFTPSWLVNQMLSKLSHYSKEAFKDPKKTFLDPACGNGNILIQILKQKLDNGHTPIQALSTIYGCDIMRDNIKECHARLLKVIQSYNYQLSLELVNILATNIVCTPLDKYQKGSLDYLDLDESLSFINNPQDINYYNELINMLEVVNIMDDKNPYEK